MSHRPGSEAAMPDGPAIAMHHFILANEFVVDRSGVDGSMPDWFGDTGVIELAAQARIATPRPRFAYIETQSTGEAGHYLSLVEDICAAAERAGLAPMVGANRNLPATEVLGKLAGGVDPCFSDYSQAPEPHVTPSHFAEELWGYLRRHHLTAGDYVYLHMPFPTLIAGILRDRGDASARRAAGVPGADLLVGRDLPLARDPRDQALAARSRNSAPGAATACGSLSNRSRSRIISHPMSGGNCRCC